jgi:hypothetical protein
MANSADQPSDSARGWSLQEFRTLVAEELQALGFSIERWHADGLDYRDPHGQTGYLGLTNVLRRYFSVDQELRLAILRDFLGHVLQSGAYRRESPERLSDFQFRILVRIGRPFSSLDAQPWNKPLPGTDLFFHLVIDHPGFMTYVTVEQMLESQQSSEEWLNQAMENLKDRTPVDWLERLHEPSGIQVGHLNDSYDASRALILTEIVDSPPAGWLVAIPSRDWLFCRPVTADGLPHLYLLKVLAEKNYAREPYPISDEVYWIRGHRWQRFPMEIAGETIRMTPPHGFIEAIGGLHPMIDAVSDQG